MTQAFPAAERLPEHVLVLPVYSSLYAFFSVAVQSLRIVRMEPRDRSECRLHESITRVECCATLIEGMHGATSRCCSREMGIGRPVLKR